MTDEIDSIVNEIEKIRHDNNKNWMGLLRLALRAEPKATKFLLQSITRNDRRISDLTQKLAEAG